MMGKAWNPSTEVLGYCQPSRFAGLLMTLMYTKMALQNLDYVSVRRCLRVKASVNLLCWANSTAGV